MKRHKDKKMEFLETYREALLEEYRYLSKSNPRIPLFDGKFEYEEKNGYVYSFALNKELGVPDGTPIYVYSEHFNSTKGSVLYSEGYEIVIKVQNRLDLKSKIEFTSSVHELLMALIERLEEIDYSDNLVRSLICGRNYCSKGEPAIGQSKAITMSLNRPITVIWGPPGTGKTHTLAEIALKFYEQGKRVLIVSQSNIAVDNAMLKIKSFVKERSYYGSVEGKIFRAGYSKIKEVFSVSDANDFYINARQYVEKTNPALINELSLLTNLRDKENIPEKKKIITDKIRDIRSFIHSKEEELIYSAQILGTTISKATVDTIISSRQFDVVLFDEASMAYVPQIVYACSLAKGHFVCIGDFRQLPPIVQSSDENILNKDIFDFLGIYEAPVFLNHQWLVMLNVQMRMHPHISGFVRKMIYSQRLMDHPCTQRNRDDILKKGPLSGHPLGYFNIDQLAGSAQSKEIGKTHSHSNCISAYVSVLIALGAKKAGQETVAVISPYKNQVNLIKSILLDLKIGQDDGVYCSTIHQFQGRECNVIIFDTVDADPMKKMGKMLCQGDDSKRLINVAMTRAEGKFILVGSKFLAQGHNILGALWQYMIEKGRAVPLDSILNADVHPKVCHLSSVKDVTSLIKDNKRFAMLASFNNQALKAHSEFFDVLNNVDFTDRDFLFIDKTVEEDKLSHVATPINKIAKLKIGYKSEAYCSDNLIVLDERHAIFPVFSVQQSEYVYFSHVGKHTVNTLMDFQFEQFIQESKMKAPIKAVKVVNKDKWIRCPHCELNLMHPGETMCSECAGMLKPKKVVVIAEKDKVSLYEICELWAKLLGETHIKWFYDKNKQVLRKTLNSNSKISHVLGVAHGDPTKKITYYDRNAVFREFFKVEKRVGPAISKCGITSYAQLENNMIFVSANID